MEYSLLSNIKQNIQHVMTSLEEPLATIWQFLDKYNTTYGPIPYQNLGFQNFNQFVMSVTDVVNVHIVNGELMLTPVTEYSKKKFHVPVAAPPTIETKEVPADLEPKVLHLLNWYDKGIALSEFGAKFEKFHGKLDESMTLEKWRELLMNMSIAEVRKDDVIFKATPKEIKVEPPSRSPEPVPEERTSKKRTLEMTFIEDNESYFRQILAKFKRGLEAAKFPEEYMKVANVPLEYQTLGFKSVVEFAKSLPGIFKLHKSTNGKGWLLFESKIKLPLRTREIPPVIVKPNKPPALPPDMQPIKPPQEPFNREAYVKVFDWKCCTAPANAPSDAVTEKINLLLQSIPPDKKATDNLEVYVSYVLNPDNIWIQLRGMATSVGLDKLMDELHLWYSGPNGNDYKIPFASVVSDLTCAVIFPEDNNWHRGIITNVYETEADVYFFDYGNTCRVDFDVLRYLRTKFTELPAQALSAELALIAPKNDIWDVSARDRILSVVTNKPLIATIKEIKDSQRLSVVLCDTSGEDDVFINHLLVQEGFAICR